MMSRREYLKWKKIAEAEIKAMKNKQKRKEAAEAPLPSSTQKHADNRQCQFDKRKTILNKTKEMLKEVPDEKLDQVWDEVYATIKEAQTK